MVCARTARNRVDASASAVRYHEELIAGLNAKVAFDRIVASEAEPPNMLANLV
jgi:hypothetical protein